MLRNSQDRASLSCPHMCSVPNHYCSGWKHCILNTTDQDKEVKHSMLTPAQPTPTPRLGTVPLRGLTRGQPIKPPAIKLQDLNATFFFFLDPGVWWEIKFGPLKLLPVTVCAVFVFFPCRVVEEDLLTALCPWDSSGLMEVEHLCEALKSHEGETALDAEQGDCDYPCPHFFPLTP